MAQGKKKKAAKKAFPKKAVAKKLAPKAAAKKMAAPKKTAAPKKALLAKSTWVQPKALPKIDFKKFLMPLADRLIVQLAAKETKTAGGLYIPDTVADTSGNLEGLVLAVGRGHTDKKGRLRPMDVKVGDQVVFPNFTGNKMNLQGVDVIILHEVDIMGLIQK